MSDPNIVRLLNIVHADGHKLYLVFEFLDLDLKVDVAKLFRKALL